MADNAPGAPAPAAPAAPASTPQPAAAAEPKGAPAPAGEAQAEAQAKELWKLQVDGEEIDYDPSDKEAVKRDVQLARAAQKRMQEAAEQMRRVQRFASQLGDPTKAIDLIVKAAVKSGKDPAQVRLALEQHLAGEIKQEMMSPEEREAAKMKAELEAYRASERSTADKRAKQVVTKAFTEAFKEIDLPVTTETMQRAESLLRHCAKQGWKVTPQQIAQKVEQDMLEAYAPFLDNPKRLRSFVERARAPLAGLDADEFLDMLGEPLAAKAREAEMKRHHARNPDGTFASPQKSAAPQSKTAEPAKKQVMGRTAYLASLKG